MKQDEIEIGEYYSDDLGGIRRVDDIYQKQIGPNKYEARAKYTVIAVKSKGSHQKSGEKSETGLKGFAQWAYRWISVQEIAKV